MFLKLYGNFSPTANIWCVELTLTNEDDEKSLELTTYLRKEIGENFSIWTLGDFLTRIRQYKQAENYYKLLEYTLPETETDRATIYNRIAYVKYEKTEYFDALDKLREAIKNSLEDGEAGTVDEFNHEMAAAEASLAVVCAPALRRKLENHKTTTKYLVSNPASIAIIKSNVGLIYHQRGNSDFALKCYNDALNILLKSETSFLREISAIYNNTGGVQFSKRSYTDAAEWFRLALVTILKSDSSDPWIQEYTNNYQLAQRHIDSNKSKRFKAE